MTARRTTICLLIAVLALVTLAPLLRSGFTTTDDLLIALGQRSESNLDARHGSELLLFLGRSLAAIIRRWLVNSES